MPTRRQPRKPDAFPQQSVHAALNSAVRGSTHLSDDQRPVVALGRVLAKRVDKLAASGFVVDGRFDNVSAGMLLKVFDSLGLTVKGPRAARVPTQEESLVPSSSPGEKQQSEATVTKLDGFRKQGTA
ncbi:hypothetical protein EDF35_1926 [Rathayibacter sp. PhB151]|uniref:hypothetical protein n=1 Tax=Rathayibacter sp. PhB151 TaxID=2485189 RepID=UPI00106290F6|nr:hypothetical protein [Rathayibacter sp. PhB151]TDX78712.1 hypothetical protein EDF35_1926 [Rathayibacter sp. PhB151]